MTAIPSYSEVVRSNMYCAVWLPTGEGGHDIKRYGCEWPSQGDEGQLHRDAVKIPKPTVLILMWVSVKMGLNKKVVIGLTVIDYYTGAGLNSSRRLYCYGSDRELVVDPACLSSGGTAHARRFLLGFSFRFVPELDRERDRLGSGCGLGTQVVHACFQTHAPPQEYGFALRIHQ